MIGVLAAKVRDEQGQHFGTSDLGGDIDCVARLYLTPWAFLGAQMGTLDGGVGAEGRYTEQGTARTGGEDEDWRGYLDNLKHHPLSPSRN